MHTNHIDTRHHFLRDLVEDKYMDIKYTISKEKTADILTKKYSEDDYVKHINRLVPARDVYFFYTRSHFSALQNCALIFSTNL